MAAPRLTIIVEAKDAASNILEGVGKSAHGLGGVLGGVGNALGSVASIASGFAIGEGLMKLPGFLMDAAKGAAEDAQGMAKLQKAVENSGAAWEDYSDQLNDTINAGIKKGFADDQQRNALALLTAQTGSAEEAQKRMKLAMDLSRGANIDLQTASKLLGKVTDENVNVLAKYGLAVDKGTSQTELFGMIQEKFGGQSDTFAKRTAGQMQSMELQMGELVETIGYAVLPIMNKLVDFASTTLVPLVEQYVVPAFELMAEWIEKGADMLGDVLGPAIGRIGGIVEKVFSGDITGALQALLDHWQETGSELITKLGEWGQALINWVGPLIPPLLQELGKMAARFLDWIVEQAPGFLEKLISEWIPSFIGFVFQLQIELIKNLPTILMTIGQWIADAAPVVGEYALKIGGAILSGILRGLGNLAGQLGAAIAAELGKLRVDVGPFHISASGFRFDVPSLPFGGSPPSGGTNSSGRVSGDTTGLVEGSAEWWKEMNFRNNLPSFDAGGIVPGPRGQPRLVIAHGGEQISQPGEGGGQPVVINVYGSVLSEGDLVAKVREGLLRLKSSNVSLGLA